MQKVIMFGAIAALACAPSVAQDALPDHAFLGDLPGVVDVVVVSTGDQLDTGKIRSAALKRLSRHGLLVDWVGTTVQPQLLIQIQAFHDTPRAGDITHHTYYVDVRLKEPASTERKPGALFLATTWSHRSRVASFGADLDSEPLVDDITRAVNAFIHDALLERQMRR